MSAFLSVKKRGAWHAHIAVHRSFESLRGEGCDGQVLRPSEDCLAGCCGEGNVDVSKAVRRRRCSVAKLAAYLSKYISKGFEECEGGDSTALVARVCLLR